MLAADGVDEVLSWFAGHPGVLAHSASRDGRPERCTSTPATTPSWSSCRTTGTSCARWTRSTGGRSVDATCAAPRRTWTCFLWGRPTAGPVAEEGDREVLERLFSRLHLAVSD